MKKIIMLFTIMAFISCKNETVEKSNSKVTEQIISTPTVEKKITKEEIKQLIKNEYKSMNEDLGGFKRPPNVSKGKLQDLLNKAKGSTYEDKILVSIDSLNKVMDKNILENQIIERKEYETTLRNSFLDNNLNIRVKVSGTENTKITLSYALFNEVWFRKFETEGHFDKLAKKGFKKITLTDNYDYSQWMTYN